MEDNNNTMNCDSLRIIAIKSAIMMPTMTTMMRMISTESTMMTMRVMTARVMAVIAMTMSMAMLVATLKL